MAFLEVMFSNGNVEAPSLEEGECWHLPIFGVYHPRKSGQARVVLDSSAQFQGASPNSVLLTGQELMNIKLCELICFRKEPIAITADIQHVFYCFLV